MRSFEKPDLSAIDAIVYDNPLEQFKAAVAASGGTVEEGVERELTSTDGKTPAELDGTEVAVVKGVFGVAENGAVWIEQTVSERALYFIAETLVIVLDKTQIVNNMHEAYARVDGRSFDFGVFISGPSKTADIEQALVFGAHGARSVIVSLK